VAGPLITGFIVVRSPEVAVYPFHSHGAHIDIEPDRDRGSDDILLDEIRAALATPQGASVTPLLMRHRHAECEGAQ
jgi:hypothetical protein